MESFTKAVRDRRTPNQRLLMNPPPNHILVKKSGLGNQRQIKNRDSNAENEDVRELSSVPPKMQTPLGLTLNTIQLKSKARLI
jgi:hypothetical protein